MRCVFTAAEGVQYCSQLRKTDYRDSDTVSDTMDSSNTS